MADLFYDVRYCFCQSFQKTVTYSSGRTTPGSKVYYSGWSTVKYKKTK